MRDFPGPLRVFAEQAKADRDAARAKLRDEFAKAALTGMHARDTYDEGLRTPPQRAHVAYVDADAMLAERDKKGGGQ